MFEDMNDFAELMCEEIKKDILKACGTVEGFYDAYFSDVNFMSVILAEDLYD